MPDPAASELLPLATELVAPIPGGAPVGSDPKYSAEFEFVKAEIAKTSERDWEPIVVAARKVLNAQAKDLTLLCYHVLASTVARGWGEGAAAAQALSGLARDHWDTIHPERERARQNAFKWLVEERTVGTFAQVAHATADHEHLATFSRALGELRDLLAAKFPDAPPSVKPLLQLVDEKVKATRPTPSAAPAAAAPSASPSPVSTAPASAPVAAPSVPDGASKGDLAQALQKVALAWWTADPSSPMGYKLLRVCRWQELTALPRNEGGKTSIPPPNPARVSFLEGQYAQKAWAAILEKCEGIFTEPGLHFWLDLQQWVLEGLQARGQDACADAVRTELKGLLRRLPGLVDLRYADGTPFASARARDWLEGLLQEGSGGGARSAAAREDSLESDVEKARALVSDGQVADALELLQSGLTYGDLRSRTVRQLEIARTAFQAGKVRPALSVAQELSERSARMGLGAWEPQLEREILEIHLKSLGAALEAGAGDPVRLREERELLARQSASSNPALLARFDF
jgi:type VI secretion system protein VasJ